MPKLSILVPVYNVAPFLPSCLDSILAQTEEDLEIICIDDGSTDDGGAILDAYVGRDRRIRVIHKKNTGYGHSMNLGLEAAVGEYIGIVESDDRVEPSYFADLYSKAAANDLDIIKGSCTYVWEKEAYHYPYREEALRVYLDKLIPREKLWLRCQFLMNVWAGIYRRKFLVANGIRFNKTPGAAYQDNGFWMQGMIFADRVMFTENTGYYYRQDNGAASVRDPQKIYDMVDEYAWLAEHLRERVSQRQMDVVNAFRLIRGYWSFFRIDDSRKREFCDRLISDYTRYGTVFTTDLTWQELYYRVANDPEGFCKRVIDTKADRERKIEESGSIVIYGAGKRGQKMFRLCCDRGWRSKLTCFAETERRGDATMASVPIYQIDDDRINNRNALVIISASDASAMAKEMRRKCSELGFMNVIGSDGFFENYYMLT